MNEETNKIIWFHSYLKIFFHRPIIVRCVVDVCVCVCVSDKTNTPTMNGKNYIKTNLMVSLSVFVCVCLYNSIPNVYLQQQKKYTLIK